jgi:hypothetical protein
LKTFPIDKIAKKKETKKEETYYKPFLPQTTRARDKEKTAIKEAHPKLSTSIISGS